MAGRNTRQPLSSTANAEFRIPRDVEAALRSELPGVSDRLVTAIIAEIPSYTDALKGPMGRTIRAAVVLALGAFLDLASGVMALGSAEYRRVVDASYDLGRGEVRSGRSVAALLGAYRIGARISWQAFGDAGVSAGMGAADLAEFAAFVFAFIDELSAAAAAGHASESAASARTRLQDLERLGSALLSGVPDDAVVEAAARADWRPPTSLTAALVSERRARPALSALDPRTLLVPGDLAESPPDGMAVLLIPDAHGPARPGLLAALRGRGAIVGPPREWLLARSSYRRTLRAAAAAIERTEDEAIDTEAHLASLILAADEEARADLRASVLAPLHALRPAAAEKLAETLRAWLLHHGRRDDIAAALFVHPQTVRYRMGQLRELFGDGLDDPHTILELTVALG